MAKSKIITSEIWAEIRTRYQMGDGIREIARSFNIDPSNLQRRLKKEGVVSGELSKVVIEHEREVLKKMAEIPEKVQQLTTPQQQPFVQQVFDKKKEQLSVVNDITDIALKLHKNLLIQVNNLANPANKNGYKPHEAASVLRSLGMSYDTLLKQMGINPDLETNGNTAKELTIKLID